MISNSQFSEHGFLSVNRKSTPGAFLVNIDCVNSNLKLILTIVNCSFHHNMVSATWVNISEISNCSLLSLSNYVDTGNIISCDDCSFHNNISPKHSVFYISFHPIMWIDFYIHLKPSSIPTVQFSNVSFHHNSAPHSILHIDCIHNVIFTNCVVASNLGTGIFARKSIITFQGNNTLVNNSGIDGGAIALQQS